MHQITDQWLKQFATEHAAWTADQFAQIGILWPPQHGWKSKVIGKFITDAQRLRFEQRLTVKQAKASKTHSLIREPQAQSDLDREFAGIIG